MKQWKVPGLAIAAVRGDSVLMMKGYGVRTIGGTDPVDAQTMFAIGSSSKAFTGATLEMLSGRAKKEYAKEAQAVAEGEETGTPVAIAANGASDEALEAVVAM